MYESGPVRVIGAYIRHAWLMNEDVTFGFLPLYMCETHLKHDIMNKIENVWITSLVRKENF